MVIIKCLDPVYSECSDIHRVKDCLKYDSVFWKDGPFRKTRTSQPAFLCTHRKGMEKGTFLTGFTPRIKDYCQRNEIPLTIELPFPEAFKFREPCLPGISLRSDQVKLLDDIKRNTRGIIVSPTGSGKTVLAGSLISMLPESRVVFVVHTASLFRQTVDEFRGWFDRVGVVGDSEFDPKRISVVMAQTARSILEGEDKWTTNKFIDLLGDADVLIIDESHHLGNETGHYSGIMKNCFAPIRIGFTATPLKAGKAGLVCEGYLGPEIGKFAMSEGIEKGILAKPHVKLIPVPIVASIAEKRKYKDLYIAGIVTNKQRNRLIAKETAEQNKAGNSVLIIIQDVEHGQGEQIMEIAREVYGIDIKFVQGSTGGDLR
jgi:superfamily II DNA or RNA helicase